MQHWWYNKHLKIMFCLRITVDYIWLFRLWFPFLCSNVFILCLICTFSHLILLWKRWFLKQHFAQLCLLCTHPWRRSLLQLVELLFANVCYFGFFFFLSTGTDLTATEIESVAIDSDIWIWFSKTLNRPVLFQQIVYLQTYLWSQSLRKCYFVNIH